MDRIDRGIVDGALPHPATEVDIVCRMNELVAENERLRLLVGELLVENQSLRQSAKLKAVPE
jgi:hypothetical protein